VELFTVGEHLPGIVLRILCAAAAERNFFSAKQDLPGIRIAAFVLHPHDTIKLG